MTRKARGQHQKAFDPVIAPAASAAQEGLQEKVTVSTAGKRCVDNAKGGRPAQKRVCRAGEEKLRANMEFHRKWQHQHRDLEQTLNHCMIKHLFQVYIIY